MLCTQVAVGRPSAVEVRTKQQSVRYRGCDRSPDVGTWWLSPLSAIPYVIDESLIQSLVEIDPSLRLVFPDDMTDGMKSWQQFEKNRASGYYTPIPMPTRQPLVEISLIVAEVGLAGTRQFTVKSAKNRFVSRCSMTRFPKVQK
jgi:hypothetical protein